jgi:hypothetical protein
MINHFQSMIWCLFALVRIFDRSDSQFRKLISFMVGICITQQLQESSVAFSSAPAPAFFINDITIIIAATFNSDQRLHNGLRISLLTRWQEPHKFDPENPSHLRFLYSGLDVEAAETTEYMRLQFASDPAIEKAGKTFRDFHERLWFHGKMETRPEAVTVFASLQSNSQGHCPRKTPAFKR